MADKISPKELNELVEKFHSLNEAEKPAFYHANPALHAVIRGIHYPKPEEQAAS